MKKLILISALLFSFNGWAEWSLYSGSHEGEAIYIDESSIQISNDGYVYFWQLGNFNKTQGYFKSVALYTKIDCNTPRKIMPIQTNMYKKSMGKDLIEMNPEKQEWIYQLPGDDSASRMTDYVCKYAEENLTSERSTPSINFNLGDLGNQQSCCKICKKGKACGNSCISKQYVCKKPSGCACNG